MKNTTSKHNWSVENICSDLRVNKQKYLERRIDFITIELEYLNSKREEIYKEINYFEQELECSINELKLLEGDDE